MKIAVYSSLVMMGLFVFSSGLSSAYAQAPHQTFDYYELKSLLSKHKNTVASIVGLKRFSLASQKERPESTIYVYKKDNDTTQLWVRFRKSDGLANEVAWHEASATLGSLKHDAVHDGFVPVNGNSQYHHRFQNLSLLVGYMLAEDKTVPCVMRAVD